MLEEEMIDLVTYLLQSPGAPDTEEKKRRLAEIGSEIHADGGVDAMENFFFAVRNRIQGELEQDPQEFRKLWNDIDPEWKY